MMVALILLSDYTWVASKIALALLSVDTIPRNRETNSMMASE